MERMCIRIKQFIQIRNVTIKVFLVIFFYVSIVGIASFSAYTKLFNAGYYRWQTYRFYDVNIMKPVLVLSLFLVIFLITYCVCKYIGRRNNVTICEKKDRIDLIIGIDIIVTLIGIIGAILIFKEMGFTILKGSTAEISKTSESGINALLFFQLANTVLIDYYLYCKKRKVIYIANMVWKILLLVPFGSRSLFLTIILAVMLERLITKKTKMKRFIVMIVLISIFAIGYKYILSIESFNFNLLIERIFTDIAPEFREFALVIDRVPNLFPYLGVSVLIESILFIIPGSFISFLGANKFNYFGNTVQYVKDIIGSSFQGGIRSSAFSEIYLIQGYLSIIIFGVVFAILVYYIDSKINGSQDMNFMYIYYIFLGVNIGLTQLLGITVLPYKIIMISIPWLMYKVLIKIIN